MAALQVRRQEIDQWLTDNFGDARLESDIPVLEEILNRISELRRQHEAARVGKPEAVKAERRSARELHRAEKVLLKVRNKTDQVPRARQNESNVWGDTG